MAEVWRTQAHLPNGLFRNNDKRPRWKNVCATRRVESLAGLSQGCKVFLNTRGVSPERQRGLLATIMMKIYGNPSLA